MVFPGLWAGVSSSPPSDPKQGCLPRAPRWAQPSQECGGGTSRWVANEEVHYRRARPGTERSQGAARGSTWLSPVARVDLRCCFPVRRGQTSLSRESPLPCALFIWAEDFKDSFCESGLVVLSFNKMYSGSQHQALF